MMIWIGPAQCRPWRGATWHVVVGSGEQCRCILFCWSHGGSERVSSYTCLCKRMVEPEWRSTLLCIPRCWCLEVLLCQQVSKIWSWCPYPMLMLWCKGLWIMICWCNTIGASASAIPIHILGMVLWTKLCQCEPALRRAFRLGALH